MTFITLIFACFGFLSPANRGALGTAVVVLFILLGSVAGYVSARLYKGEPADVTNILFCFSLKMFSSELIVIQNKIL